MSEHYVIRKVQQALDDELSRGGMRAGLPKVALPVDQVQWLLNAARSPLSQETVDEIRDRIESYQTVKEWGLADWCNEARKSTQLLFDILAEIEGKQS